MRETDAAIPNPATVPEPVIPKRCSPNVPPSASTSSSGADPGCRVMKLIAPLLAYGPYTDDCGPRITSTLSTASDGMWAKSKLPPKAFTGTPSISRSEEHTSELQSLRHLVCRLLLE